jgi:D-threo-aldose 1-dehydrogenase
MLLTTSFPKVIFGTSCLGNLFEEIPYEVKKEIIRLVIENNPHGAVFDSAGKYGAGLSLEVLGQCLAELEVPPENVTIINKLAWKRIPLTSQEPTFEPGAWVNIQNDAIQDISYQGIMDCYEQGNELLGQYSAKIVSVHDPDEFLAAAVGEADFEQRKKDLIDAFKALQELKKTGEVLSVGVGAKDIRVIDFISNHIQLDWAMFACSITPYKHDKFAKNLLSKLARQGVEIINSAVFNSGFLLGGEFYDYQKIQPESHQELFSWREKFLALCHQYKLSAAAVCVQFSFLFPEINSVALSTSNPDRVKSNISLANTEIPHEFWLKLLEEGLIDVEL